MKIKPIDLVASWNALSELIQANDHPGFIAQAETLQMQLRNEMLFWNELSEQKRQAICQREMSVHFDKISAHPEVYANDQITDLNRFFERPLDKRPASMAALLEETEQKNESNQEEE